MIKSAFKQDEEGKNKISIHNEKIQLMNASFFEEAIKLLFVIYFNSNQINPKTVSVTLKITQTHFIKVHLDSGRKSSHTPSRKTVI
ncbi:unnamed protein product, partial [Callosobruchus maculatus]